MNETGLYMYTRTMLHSTTLCCSESGECEEDCEEEEEATSCTEDLVECRTVVVSRGAEGLGFSIVGGHQSPHGDLPVYVKKVYDATAAAAGLRHGDQILAVDGHSLQGLTHQQAVDVLKNADSPVTLTIQS